MNFVFRRSSAIIQNLFQQSFAVTQKVVNRLFHEDSSAGERVSAYPADNDNVSESLFGGDASTFGSRGEQFSDIDEEPTDDSEAFEISDGPYAERVPAAGVLRKECPAERKCSIEIFDIAYPVLEEHSESAADSIASVLDINTVNAAPVAFATQHASDCARQAALCTAAKQPYSGQDRQRMRPQYQVHLEQPLHPVSLCCDPKARGEGGNEEFMVDSLQESIQSEPNTRRYETESTRLAHRKSTDERRAPKGALASKAAGDRGCRKKTVRFEELTPPLSHSTVNYNRRLLPGLKRDTAAADRCDLGPEIESKHVRREKTACVGRLEETIPDVSPSLPVVNIYREAEPHSAASSRGSASDCEPPGGSTRPGDGHLTQAYGASIATPVPSAVRRSFPEPKTTHIVPERNAPHGLRPSEGTSSAMPEQDAPHGAGTFLAAIPEISVASQCASIQRGLLDADVSSARAHDVRRFVHPVESISTGSTQTPGDINTPLFSPVARRTPDTLSARTAAPAPERNYAHCPQNYPHIGGLSPTRHTGWTPLSASSPIRVTAGAGSGAQPDEVWDRRSFSDDRGDYSCYGQTGAPRYERHPMTYSEKRYWDQVYEYLFCYYYYHYRQYYDTWLRHYGHFYQDSSYLAQ